MSTASYSFKWHCFIVMYWKSITPKCYFFYWKMFCCLAWLTSEEFTNHKNALVTLGVCGHLFEIHSANKIHSFLSSSNILSVCMIITVYLYWLECKASMFASAKEGFCSFRRRTDVPCRLLLLQRSFHQSVSSSLQGLQRAQWLQRRVWWISLRRWVYIVIH